MKTVYSASLAVEAHMMANLLEQSDLHPQVLGADLQTAAGAIPPMNVVRVVVPDEEAETAKAIIQEFEKLEAPTTTRPTSPPWRAGNLAIASGLVGALLGGLAVFLVLRTPA